MLDLLCNVIVDSIQILNQEQEDLLENTEMTTMTEWNLGHHLANVLNRHINTLDCDLDCVKRDYHNQRPDIIFHRRGSNSMNLLVIELKIENSVNEYDIAKIINNWQSAPLNYKFGASISIDRNWNFDGIIRSMSGAQRSLISINENHCQRTQRISYEMINECFREGNANDEI